MHHNYEDFAVVIPSLEPRRELVAYVQALSDRGFGRLYVVNDGSPDSYNGIYTQIMLVDRVTVLTHDGNRGKGAALKTAFAAIKRVFPQCRGIITADSDGQHAVYDVCRLADTLRDHPGQLLLGGRDFRQPRVPLKSRVGNRLSTLLFFLLHGAWVTDTQTGLRGFDISLLDQMLAVEGDRFQYEMAVLTTCVEKKIPIFAIHIATIYLEGNVGSHFRPLEDSVTIGKVLLDRVARFLVSSGLSCLVDVALCWLLLELLRGVIAADVVRIGLAVVVARLCSMGVNYGLNRKFVFGGAGQHTFGRYLLLAVGNMAVSTAVIYWGSTILKIDERLVKVVCDVILWVLNFQIQRIWVFASKK